MEKKKCPICGISLNEDNRCPKCSWKEGELISWYTCQHCPHVVCDESGFSAGGGCCPNPCPYETKKGCPLCGFPLDEDGRCTRCEGKE